MSFSARYVPAVCFTLFTFVVAVCAQSATTQTKAPRGSLSGRVTIKDKGAPGVAVGLRKADSGNPFDPYIKTTTDHDGYYRAGNLAAGTYEIAPSVPGYVITDNNNQRTKDVLVAEDENVEGINFSLVRGGVITGKVTDADGRALILQQIFLLKTDPSPQQQGVPPRPVFSTNAAVTDDRGIYRMYGLTAGSYKVAAGRSDDSFGTPGMLSRSTYKRVFHPDATEESRATVITVTEGSEANNVDIALGRPQPTFSVSGKVIDNEKGTPVPNLRFGLQRGAAPRFELVPTQIVSNVQGDFLVEGLVPGKYSIFLFPTPLQNPNPDMRAEAITFDVVDSDVTGLTVRLVKGASLNGVAVLDTDDKAVIQKFQQLILRAFVMTAPGMSGLGQSSSSPIGPDGSFRLAGLPAGTASITLGSQMGPLQIKGFTISRIERDGVTLAPRGLEVKDGEQVTGLRVIVSYGNASIRGVVKVENGSLPPEGQIFVRLFRPGETNSNLPFARVDSRGHFLIESLAAGVYEVQVTIGNIPAPPRRWKQEVTVQDGAVSDVVVTVDLGTTPKP